MAVINMTRAQRRAAGAKKAGLVAISTAALFFSSKHVSAGTLFWDNDATSANNPGTLGGAGTWDSTSAKWWDSATGASGPDQTWVAAGGQDIADFRGTA